MRLEGPLGEAGQDDLKAVYRVQAPTGETSTMEVAKRWESPVELLHGLTTNAAERRFAGSKGGCRLHD